MLFFEKGMPIIPPIPPDGARHGFEIHGGFSLNLCEILGSLAGID